MSKYLKLTIRFYPGQDDDLIAWLEEMRASYGKKGETVKGTLRKGLGAVDSASAVALDHGSLLADIRQVMESSLASYAFQPVFYIIKGNHPGKKLLFKKSPPYSVFSVR